MDCRYLMCVMAQLVVACSANISAVNEGTPSETEVEDDFPSGVYFYLSSYKKLVDENKILRDVIDEKQKRLNAIISMEKHLQILEETTRQLRAQLNRNGPFLRHIRGLRLVETFNSDHNWALLKKGLVGVLDHSDVAYQQMQKLFREDEEYVTVIVQEGDKELLEVLLDYGLDVDTRDFGAPGGTILHSAARYNQADMAAMLLDRGASTSEWDIDGETPLVVAAASNSMPVLRLLKESGADVDAASHSGRTGLHYAADKGYLEVVRYLVESGANTGKTDNADTTPLELAKRAGHEEVVNILS